MKTAKIVAVVLCTIATPFLLIECLMKWKNPQSIIRNPWSIMLMRAKMTKKQE